MEVKEYLQEAEDSMQMTIMAVQRQSQTLLT